MLNLELVVHEQGDKHFAISSTYRGITFPKYVHIHDLAPNETFINFLLFTVTPAAKLVQPFKWTLNDWSDS